VADDPRLNQHDPQDDRLPVDKPAKADGDDTVHGTIPKPKGQK
jgi:hypothetical protein